MATVEEFLLARDTGDAVGAANWCVSPLRIEDLSGTWFADDRTTVQWLRQLAATYLRDTLVPPHADGEVVTWTERLTPRSIRPQQELASTVTVQVRALVHDRKLVSLSGAYPALVGAPPALQAAAPARGNATSAAAPPPLVLFVVSAFGFGAVAVVSAAILKRRRRGSGVGGARK